VCVRSAVQPDGAFAFPFQRRRTPQQRLGDRDVAQITERLMARDALLQQACPRREGGAEAEHGKGDARIAPQRTGAGESLLEQFGRALEIAPQPIDHAEAGQRSSDPMLVADRFCEGEARAAERHRHVIGGVQTGEMACPHERLHPQPRRHRVAEDC
jgi:hypothetical protein